MSGLLVPDPSIGCTNEVTRQLVAAAFRTIRRRYVMARHQIAAALLDADGQVHVGLHVDAMVGRAAVCAEAGALSAARLVTDAELIAVAAVRYPKPTEAPTAKVVPPCGLCRELLFDHAPGLVAVISRPDGGTELTALGSLLPHKYVGSKWPAPVLPS
ncbi:hypothetical protein ACFV19_21010 [Streptomyces griseoluteus]|uniref:hypothetical protein n=1 Tax=Streptomyces griseoluteus TaxID=29306 RepID=UPI00367B266B